MIRKAMKEKVIQEQTNLYDHFFVPTSESKVKVTAAHLPYFDSDFWPGKADILLEDKNKSQAKGSKAVIERALRAAKRDASTGNPKDILLMHQVSLFSFCFSHPLYLLHSLFATFPYSKFS